MADDLTNRGPADHSRVNSNEHSEIKYWCPKWGCTEVELKAAVQAVGASAAKVEHHLAIRRQKRK